MTTLLIYYNTSQHFGNVLAIRKQKVLIPKTKNEMNSIILMIILSILLTKNIYNIIIVTCVEIIHLQVVVY